MHSIFQLYRIWRISSAVLKYGNVLSPKLTIVITLQPPGDEEIAELVRILTAQVKMANRYFEFDKLPSLIQKSPLSFYGIKTCIRAAIKVVEKACAINPGTFCPAGLNRVMIDNLYPTEAQAGETFFF